MATGTLREAFGEALGKIARTGRLASDWTPDTATDWVWARTHLSTYRNLVGERGWTHEQFVERGISTLLSELVNPEFVPSALR